MQFWSTHTEVKFFERALSSFAAPEQLFYRLEDGFFAYAPKGKTTEKQTLQSRNSLIGQFTEKWCKDFLHPIAEKFGLFAVNGVVCPALSITESSRADIAFCTTPSTEQQPQDIKLIIEVKMSIVNNYQYTTGQKIHFVGDYKTHKGVPSILRSDSMLKAIGKAINIRTTGVASSQIPILILSNSPITKSYVEKVDFLKNSGVIQGFISVYPNPTQDCILKTPNGGFQTLDDYEDLYLFIKSLLDVERYFFSAMLSKRQIGHIISIAAEQPNERLRAEKFLDLLKSTIS